MSKPIFDQTQDLTGSDQYRLTQLYSAPEFVKQASHEQLCGEPENLQPHMYADQRQRLYPCHTKAACWMSALFFGEKQAQYSKTDREIVRERLLNSAGYWNIETDVSNLWTKMAEDEKDEFAKLADSDFALVWQTADDHKERHYPLRNGVEVKVAADWLSRYHRELTFDDKHVVATKILEKAAAFNADIDNRDMLERFAGFGYCSNKDAADAWEKRATLVQRNYPQLAEQGRAVVAALTAGPFEARDQGYRIKMASLLDQFDRETGLTQLYDDGGLARPEDVLFQITEKVASDFLGRHVQTTTGTIYEKVALATLDTETLRSWMGDEFADDCGGVMLDVQKLADIIPTLPRPDAEMFERMAQAAGVPVFGKEKSAATMSDEERLELAAIYQQQLQQS